MEYKNVEIDACELVKKANENFTHLNYYKHCLRNNRLYSSCTGLSQGISKTIGKREKPYHVKDILDLINYYIDNGTTCNNNFQANRVRAAILSRSLIELGYIPIKPLNICDHLSNSSLFSEWLNINLHHINRHIKHFFDDFDDDKIFVYSEKKEDETPIEEIKKPKRRRRHAKVSSPEQDCHHEDNSLTVDASVFTAKVPHIGDPDTRNIVISSSCMKTGRFIVLDNGQTIIITDD